MCDKLNLGGTSSRTQRFRLQTRTSESLSFINSVGTCLVILFLRFFSPFLSRFIRFRFIGDTFFRFINWGKIRPFCSKPSSSLSFAVLMFGGSFLSYFSVRLNRCESIILMANGFELLSANIVCLPPTCASEFISCEKWCWVLWFLQSFQRAAVPSCILREDLQVIN